MLTLFPSIIAGDILNLEQQITMLEPYCDGFHIDIMDFHYVPNLTCGPLFANAIRKVTKKPLWVHLMVDTPAKYLPLLELHKGDCISCHFEGMKLADLSVLLKQIMDKRLLAGVALKPTTDIAVLTPLLTPAHTNPALVLLMSVDPGFSGQPLLENTFERLEALCDVRDTTKTHFTIAVDGGVSGDNIKQLADSGAEQCAVGSAIFSTKDPVTAIQNLKKLL